MLLSQSVFHVLFAALGAALTPGGSFGSHHHGSVLMTPGPTLAAVAPDTAMLTAHVIAGVLTIAMLWRGEQLLRGIAYWARTALRSRTPRPLAGFDLPATLNATARLFVSTIRAGDLSLRGPPSLSRG